MSRPPLPPFTRETAAQKARMAEDAWNSRDPERVALAYTEDSRWRNRSEFFEGRAAIVAFLTRKWAKEHEYRLIKDLWAFDGNRIAVRFQYEWHDDAGQWHRSYGNEQWEFDEADHWRCNAPVQHGGEKGVGHAEMVEHEFTPLEVFVEVVETREIFLQRI